MGLPAIVFLDADTLPVPLRRPGFAHAWTQHGNSTPDQVVARLQGATIALTNKVRLGEAELAALPDLRLIAIAATGTDVVDLAACARRGVAVCNVRGYAGRGVPEHVFMLILALRRQLIGLRADLAAGRWQAAQTFCLLDRPIEDLHG